MANIFYEDATASLGLSGIGKTLKDIVELLGQFESRQGTKLRKEAPLAVRGRQVARAFRQNL